MRYKRTVGKEIGKHVYKPKHDFYDIIEIIHKRNLNLGQNKHMEEGYLKLKCSKFLVAVGREVKILTLDLIKC